MIFLRFFHFLTGYVIFSAQGGFPERFINLCAAMRIPVRDIRSRDGTLIGCTSIDGYKMLRHAARKSGMRVRIVRRVGMPFFLHRYRRRVGLLAGLAVLMVFLSVMSGLVWAVDIVGNVNVTDEEILAVFEELGLRQGVRSSSVKAAELEKAAPELLPGIQWIAVNINGSAVTIEVRERLIVGETEDYSRPHHIAAIQDGVIETLEVYEGTAMTSVGSAVAEGDLIISGITENADGSAVFHHAKGYAVARVTETYELSAQRRRVAASIVSTKRRVTLSFLGLRLPPRAIRAEDEEAVVYDSDRWLYAGERRLPIGYTMTRSLYYETRNVEYTDGELRLAAAAGILRDAADEYKYSTILSQSVIVSESMHGISMKASYTLLRNIGAEKAFTVEETDALPQ